MRIAGIAMVALCSVCMANGSLNTEPNVDNPVSKIIPLSEVWALDMPGTRRMSKTRRGNPPVYEAPEGALVDEIVAALTYWDQLPTDIRKKFVSSGIGSLIVPRQGMYALREAHAILVDGKTPKTEFANDEALSAFFFTFPSGKFIHLSNLEQQGETVRLFFQTVSHKSKQMTIHIALVPITNTSSGHIRILTQPLDSEPDQNP